MVRVEMRFHHKNNEGRQKYFLQTFILFRDMRTFPRFLKPRSFDAKLKIFFESIEKIGFIMPKPKFRKTMSLQTFQNTIFKDTPTITRFKERKSEWHLNGRDRVVFGPHDVYEKLYIRRIYDTPLYDFPEGNYVISE